MLRLVKVELRRISSSALGIGWGLSLVAIVCMTSVIVFGIGTDGKIATMLGQDSQDKWDGWPIVAYQFAHMFTKAAFIMFEGALLSTIIIDEFKKKTIHQLFSYPVKKTEILWSKVILVVGIAFIFQAMAHVIGLAVIKSIAFSTGYSFVISVDYLVQLIVVSLGSSLLGLIPMAVGLIKYSTVMTMLTSLGIVLVTCNVFPGTLMGDVINSIPFMSVLGLLGLSVVAVTIVKITKKDIVI